MKFIKNILKSLIKIRTIKIKLLDSILNDYIILVDVGATGGIEGKWTDIEKHLHVIAFDPDPRAVTPITKGKFENYKIGLWSNTDEKELFLTAFPQASTFYQFNEKIISSFLNYPCHKNIKKMTFQVDKMENVLPKEIHPDFIKTDAEGADLEILKGSAKYLLQSCLGIQCEVSFTNRHEHAPYFSQTDQFLRQYNFVLMELETEKWIRKNNVFTGISKPQLIWANAVYMLSIDAFLKKIKNMPEKTRCEKISKFITILLIHKFHDYAYELCENAYMNMSISNNNYLELKNFIKQSMPSYCKCYVKSIISILITFCLLILCCLLPSKRKKALAFLKARIKDLARLLINTRHGPYEGCV